MPCADCQSLQSPAVVLPFGSRIAMASTVAHWHGVCIQSFDKLSRALRSADPHREQQMPLSSVFDEYGRFNVWAGNIGAGAAGRVSMDYRLREASHIKEQVIKLLQYLSETLEDGNYFNYTLLLTSLRIYIYVRGSTLVYSDLTCVVQQLQSLMAPACRTKKCHQIRSPNRQKKR